MVTILPPKTNLGTDIGRALGMGFQEGIPQGMHQEFNTKRLRDAFNKIEPGGNFLDQLKNIAPELLTTQSGAQALEALAGPLATAAQNSATVEAIKRRREGQAQSPGIGGLQNGALGNISSMPSSEQVNQNQPIDFRNPKPPQSAQNPFPEVTVGPTTQPEMTPRQIEDYALDLMEQSAIAGKPIDLNTARQTALNANSDVRKYNEGIQREKDLIKEAQEAQTSHMVERAQNAGLIKSPEDKTIISKFALDARNAPNDEVAWEYVRTKAREAQTKKNGLLRNYQVPGPIEGTYQKIIGSYKDKETASKEAQPFLDFYRENGLHDEARKILSGDIGLGAEDTESWLFPFDKKQTNELNAFKSNSIKPSRPVMEPIPGLIHPEAFPGEKYQLPQEKFDIFKDDLAKVLSENPGINLISLRGKLNQDKKYAWQDISKAMNELLAEKRFKPDSVQDSQLLIVDKPPMPGLAEQFKFLWKGTK